MSLVLPTMGFGEPIQQAAGRVDAALLQDFAKVQKQNALQLPPMASDAAFLRRACIDLAGRLPKADEVRAFLADTSAGKREKLTDALVKEPSAAEARFRMLAEAFRVKEDDAVSASLRQAAADDLPYEQIVAHMIGGGHLFRRDAGDALRTGVETAFSLLGESLHCAMCHDHAFNDHTQKECYEFAACFAAKDQMRLPMDFRYRGGKPGEVVKPRLLQLEKAGAARGHDLMKWLTVANSERFATVAALRVWSSLFGLPYLGVDKTLGGIDEAAPWHEVASGWRGCFTPPSQDRSSWIGFDFKAAPSHHLAPLQLAEEFRRCGGRIGAFQSMLARTQAYGRESLSTPWYGSYLPPAPLLRRLPAEVIWDALATRLTGMATSEQLPQVPPAEHPLRMLGRGTREWTDESCTPLSHELARFMMNGELVAEVVEQAGDSQALFMELLGRKPTTQELTIIWRHATQAPATADRDVAWAVLNTREFLFR